MQLAKSKCFLDFDERVPVPAVVDAQHVRNDQVPVGLLHLVVQVTYHPVVHCVQILHVERRIAETTREPIMKNIAKLNFIYHIIAKLCK